MSFTYADAKQALTYVRSVTGLPTARFRLVASIPGVVCYAFPSMTSYTEALAHAEKVLGVTEYARGADRTWDLKNERSLLLYVLTNSDKPAGYIALHDFNSAIEPK